MEEFVIGNNTFRIKRMNAIELLAFQSSTSFESYEDSLKSFDTILEHVEVKCNDVWLQVKQKSNYYPAGIENDINAIQEIVTRFTDYLRSVFSKSSASN